MNTFNIRSLFRESWNSYKNYWRIFLLIFLTFAIVKSFSFVGMSDPQGIFLYTGTESLLSFAVLSWIGIGYIRFLLNIADGEQARYRDLFHGVKSPEQFAYFILVNIVYTAVVALGFVLLIIPGIILAIGFMFVSYYIAENRLGFSAAFHSSWEITKGHRWKLFGLLILLVFLNLAGALLLGIGLLVTIPLSQLIITRLFRHLEGIPIPEPLASEKMIEE